jgi:protein required for attachment to host cells
MAVTWVVAADGGQARFFQMEDKHEGLREIEGVMSVDGNKPSREIASDRPGRAFASMGGSRSAMEPPTDPQRFAKQAFARDIAKILLERQVEFDKLIVAAPAKTLGDLRKQFHPLVSSKVIAELDKDLTHISPQDLSLQLAVLIDYRHYSYDPAKEQKLKRRKRA